MNIAECQFFWCKMNNPKEQLYTESQAPVSPIIDDVFTVRGGDWDTLRLNRGSKWSELTQQLCLLPQLLIRIN